MDRFLRRRQVEEITGLKRSAIYDRVEDDRFPKPVPLDGRAVAWLESEVIAWMADRVAARDGKKGAPKQRRGRPPAAQSGGTV